MQFQDDPFSQLSQFGQGQMFPGGPSTMAGPSGFAGGMFGGQTQGQLPAMGQPQLPQMGQDPSAQQHHHGISPAFLMGILPGLMASGHGFGSIAPLFGLAGMLGPKLFK